jgi:hypothetical protein
MMTKRARPTRVGRSQALKLGASKFPVSRYKNDPYVQRPPLQKQPRFRPRQKPAAIAGCPYNAECRSIQRLQVT